MTATIARHWRIVVIALICLALGAGVAASCGKKPNPKNFIPYTLTAGHAPLTTCYFKAHGINAVAGVTSLSRVWVTGSTCQNHRPHWPEFYNRTRCVSSRDAVVWRNGPDRYGNGSETSNYSQVSCGGGFVVSQVWIFYYTGAGWHGHRLI